MAAEQAHEGSLRNPLVPTRPDGVPAVFFDEQAVFQIPAYQVDGENTPPAAVGRANVIVNSH